MSNKKTKIIEFDESMLELIRQYQNNQNISTFAGAVREMIETQLINHQLMKPKSNHIKIESNKLSKLENERWNDLNRFIDNYKIALDKISKLINDSNSHKTIFDYIISYYNNNNIDELIDIFSTQYIQLGKNLYRSDVVMSHLMIALDKYFIQSDILTHINTLNDINIIKDIIRAFDEALRRSTNDVSLFEIEYNKCIKKFYQFKYENKSLYDLLEYISNIISCSSYEKGVL